MGERGPEIYSDYFLVISKIRIKRIKHWENRTKAIIRKQKLGQEETSNKRESTDRDE